MKLDLLTALNAERAARRAAIVVTDVASGRERLVKAAAIAKDPLKTLLAERLRTGKSGMVETAEGRVFLTVYVPAPQLVITGAVHISQTLAPIGKLLGYDVTIVDPRTAFASIERFPDVKVIAEWPDKALPPLGIDHYTAFVALTHDPKIDDPALTHALSRDCFYIGALGSKKTHARRVARLKEQGLSDADISRIHAPIGLDIGAVSPAEIAVAIMAEITARLRESEADAPRKGRVMKFGAVAPKAALGATAVHTIRQGALVLKKGTLIGPAEVAALEAAGIKDIVAARLEPDDVSEDVAAAEIAKAVAGDGVHVDRAFTGRANLFAQTAGVLVVDKDAIDRLNRVDEAITFATLPAYKPVVAGEMIATVKIIPFAVAKDARDAALAGVGKPLLACRALSHPQGRRGVDNPAGAGAESHRKNPKNHRGAAGARGRHDHRRAACAARARRARPRARRRAQGRRGARHRVRRLRDRRPARRDSCGAGGDRRPHRAFRHAGRSRQSLDDWRRGRTSRARRAGLRPQPEGKRF